MAGRALAFSDPNNVALVKERFVGVLGDEWYTRRRDDAEGRFFQRLVAQGPRQYNPVTQGTVQGIYVATAGGKLLGFAYGDVAPGELNKILAQALETFARLPDSERRPEASTLDEAGGEDGRFVRNPPEGGLILSVHTRLLDVDENGNVERPGKTCLLNGDAPAAAQPDRMWLTKSEWQSLVPSSPHVGRAVPVNAAIVRRLARFHLIDNTRGEMPAWETTEVQLAQVSAVVEVATASETQLRLEGSFVMSRPAQAKDAGRSFAVRLIGRIHYDGVNHRIDQFDMVAMGEHRGNGPHMAALPPGPHVVGIAFEQMDESEPFARIPPHGARHLEDYWGGPPSP